MDSRHHHASRPVVILIEAGSPKLIRQTKPRPYKRNSREPWRPQRDIPRPGKAEKLARFLDAMRRQDEIARSMMRPRADLLKAQWGMAAW